MDMTVSLPAPPVPPDCDLRDFAFMPLDVRRLRDSDLAAIEDAEAFRAAILAFCVAWHQVPAASLPDDDAALCRLLGYGRDLKTWKRARDAGALRGWLRCSDGRLYHPVTAEKALLSWSRKQAQRDRARKGASKRWGMPEAPAHDASSIAPSMHDDSLRCPKGEGEGEGEENPPNPPPLARQGEPSSSKPKRRQPRGLRGSGTSPRELRHAAEAAEEAARPPPPEPDHPLWPACKARGMAPAVFRRWLAPLRMRGLPDADDPLDPAVFEAPSAFHASHVRCEFHHVVSAAVGRPVEVVSRG
jgi:hypothetical protein